jgi:hypothetical protein
MSSHIIPHAQAHLTMMEEKIGADTLAEIRRKNELEEQRLLQLRISQQNELARQLQIRQQQLQQQRMAQQLMMASMMDSITAMTISNMFNNL